MLIFKGEGQGLLVNSTPFPILACSPTPRSSGKSNVAQEPSAVNSNCVWLLREREKWRANGNGCNTACKTLWTMHQGMLLLHSCFCFLVGVCFISVRALLLFSLFGIIQKTFATGKKKEWLLMREVALVLTRRWSHTDREREREGETVLTVHRNSAKRCD